MTSKVALNSQDLTTTTTTITKPPLAPSSMESSVARTRQREKLKITDSLVAPPAEKQPVPDHALNTKIYAKLQRNRYFEVAPTEVHFSGFEVDNKTSKKKYTQMLRIINVSDQVQRLVVLPPQSKQFDIYYVKQERIVPGFAVEVQVLFKPDEYKYYSDAIRIMTEGDENLYVPIHAYPIVSTYDFPSEYKFPNLAIGRSLTRTFRMRSTAPVEFEYMIEILQKHAAFSIEPLEGIIPFNEDALINVTFSPKEFCTATLVIQLVVSQFNSKPIVCTFFGTSKPGMARDEFYSKYKKLSTSSETKFNMEQDASDQLTIDDMQYSINKSQSHITSSTKLKSSTNKKNSQSHEASQDVAGVKQRYVDYEGYRFPTNLNNPWAVSKVLIQTKGKVSLKEIKSATSSAKSASVKLTAQAKETLFIKKVLDLEDEERKNQLKWQVKLGEDPIDEATRQDILNSRAQADYEYRLSIGVPFLNQELARQKTIEVQCRPYRDYNKLGKTDITFDLYKSHTWKIRYMALERFIQAARKIIVKSRLIKVLRMLKNFVNSYYEAMQESPLNAAELTIEVYIETYSKKLHGENMDHPQLLRSITVKTMGTFYFPHVTEHKESNDLKLPHCEKLHSISKLDSLAAVAVRPLEFRTNVEIPYIGLSIPVNYKLNAYKPITGGNSFYVSKHENRMHKLRMGAEDELTQIDSMSIMPLSSDLQSQRADTKLDTGLLSSRIITNTAATMSKASLNSQSSIKQMDVVGADSPQRNTLSQQSVATPEIVDLRPARNLNMPPEYPPIHIFNPMPGLMSFHKLMPYSGIDLNHHLNPLPRFEREQPSSTQKKFLDREDVIKGIMTWKKFPSQGLTSLSNTPTLTDVWVPRWSNTFSKDILPFETPELLDGLPHDDKDLLPPTDNESDQDSVASSKRLYLTAQMVNAQFNVPDIFVKKEKNMKDEVTKQSSRSIYTRNANQEVQFPMNDKLPTTNLPVSIFGQVPRDQREQELDYFLKKQYNSVGLRLYNNLNALEPLFKSSTPTPSNNSQTGGNQLNNASFVSTSTMSIQQ